MGLFSNPYDVQASQQKQDSSRAMQYANAPRGRVPVAVASQAGSMLGRGIMGGLGFQSPQEQKLATINKVKQQFAGQDETDPQVLAKIANAFDEERLFDIAQQVRDSMAEQQKLTTGTDSRGSMQKAVEFSAKIRGCKEGDNICYKEAVLDAKDYKRTSESDSEEAKLHASLSKGIYEAGSTAHEDIARYDQLLSILPDIYTGWGGEAIAYPVAQVADFLGLDKESAGKMEVFRSGAMSQALTYIAQTKGAVSDREFSAFREAAAGLGRSELGNKLLLRTAKEYAKFRKAKAAELAAWTTKERAARRVPTAAGWQIHFSDWAHKKENMVHLPTQAEVEQALGMSTGPSSSSLENLKKRHQALKGK